MMFFKSIRFKVLLWYMLLLTVTLVLFSAALYGSFNKILVNNLDDLLSSRAEGVIDSVHTYYHAKEGVPSLASFLNIAREWVEEKRKDPELMNIFVQILDTKGERLIATKSMPFIAPVPKSDFEDLIAGEDDFDTFNGISSDGRKTKFRVYSKPEIEDGSVTYIIQAAAPIGLVSLALNNLILVLILLLPLTVILAGIPGVLLAGLTLRPVNKMINTLRQITAENLKLKIHIPDTKDEIRRLADTFNEMIERLDRSFSSQQSFIQDISYELKVPINALKNKFEDAAKNPYSKEGFEAILRGGLAEADKFSLIIDDLLALAKFDNSQMPLEIKKVNLTGLLNEAAGSMRPAAEGKGIAFSSFLKDEIILDGDETQLKKLFTNLIDNAVKYTYRKGKISLAARKDKGSAKITVSDTGVGMPEDELSYIFDRFYQIKKPRNGQQGFGLGLSIAKSIVESHKGKIAVESQVGQGSVFTVLLPISYPG
ncbi:MAG: HAMP domain-containing sensor histidine kinase [Candidatus Omnitrophota bacterium]|nr:HAMP domain-containing sensor histidine kinase [Candidatus Omnitrophota bacterium]